MGQGDRWAETIWDRETGGLRQYGTGRQGVKHSVGQAETARNLETGEVR